MAERRTKPQMRRNIHRREDGEEDDDEETPSMQKTQLSRLRDLVTGDHGTG